VQLLVHGGAGSPPDAPAERGATLATAAERGGKTATPLDAVCAAVRVLEADPRFNAGVGGAVQSDGRVRTDAGVMTGAGTTGAAAAMDGVCHAVSVARAVAEETPHVLVAGERAVDLAGAVGVETDRDLLTEESRRRHREADPPDGAFGRHLDWVRERFGDDDGRDHDTVGAVASDGDSVAAATSTGGRWHALAGRVGDVPQVGGGFYAAPAGAASATGTGEDIAREGLARRAVDLLNEHDPNVAAERAIAAFGERADGQAGVIVVDADGETGAAYDSPAMATAAWP